MSKKTIEYGNNMMLIRSYDGQDDTFKMMAINNDCPYLEVMYHTQMGIMIVVSKCSYEKPQRVPVLDSNGDVEMRKKPVKDRPAYKEKRIMIQAQQEHQIITKEEQVAFIKQFAINEDSFEYNKFLRADDSPNPNLTVLGKPTIVGEDGKDVSSKKESKLEIVKP
jgi:hypothetical protein